tara:strand:+ start:6268 stop:6510 length:243 start_codon:yes stop_codon:yes gene_type:complete
MISTAGHSVFSQLIDTSSSLSSVDYKDYQQWCKQYTFNALKTGNRYGQDFCDCFDITDYILYYCFDSDRADKHIKKYYIK